MRKREQILLCMAFSLMFMFITVGYARVSDTLIVDGTLQYDKEPKTVFIVSIDGFSASNTSGSSPAITQTGTLTFKHSNYTLKTQGNGKSGGSFTVTVTVKNNSGVDQYFGAHSSTSQTDVKEKLKNCKFICNQTQEYRLVRHGETKTFTFIVQNTSWNNVSMNGLESLLLFSPDFDNTAATQNATEVLAQGFGNILNGKGPNGDPNETITFNGRQYKASEIVSKLLVSRDNGGVLEPVDTGGYMGNVPSAPSEQQELVELMFGDQIVLEIGSNYYSVYVLIKNQQIDEDNTNDMVIYITADQLNMGSGGWQNGAYRNLNNVPVYGLVYIKQGGEYKYCNHLFVGEAPVCDFGGAFGDGYVGNFNTNLWNSTEFQSVTNTSGGAITETYISQNGELDEAYKYFRDQYLAANPNNKLSDILISLDQIAVAQTESQELQ